MPFSALREKDFVGRQEELAALTKRVVLALGGQARSAVLSGPRGMGRTELQQQLFGRLFWGQDRVAPFSSGLTLRFATALPAGQQEAFMSAQPDFA